MISTPNDAHLGVFLVRWICETEGVFRLVGVSGLLIATIQPGKLSCCGRTGGHVWSLDGWIFGPGHHGHADTQEEARVAVVDALAKVKATAAGMARVAPLP